MTEKLLKIAAEFVLEGTISEITPLGQGFINDTFIIHTEGEAPNYILQRKNKSIFPDVPAMMDNIDRVTAHIRKKVAAEGGDTRREVMTINQTHDGKFYHIDGYFDRGVRMDDGFLTLPNFQPGTDSFSVGVWFKNGLASGDPPILSNKSWRGGGNPGFVIGLSGTTAFFNVAAPGIGRFDTGSLFPLDYKEGWVYVIWSVDRAANTIGMSIDFEPMEVRPMPEAYKGISFNTDMPVRIGQDGTGTYGCPLAVLIDELVIANRALNDDDVAALKKLYVGE